MKPLIWLFFASIQKEFLAVKIKTLKPPSICHSPFSAGEFNGIKLKTLRFGFFNFFLMRQCEAYSS